MDVRHVGAPSPDANPVLPGQSIIRGYAATPEPDGARAPIPPPVKLNKDRDSKVSKLGLRRAIVLGRLRMVGLTCFESRPRLPITMPQECMKQTNDTIRKTEPPFKV